MTNYILLFLSTVLLLAAIRAGRVFAGNRIVSASILSAVFGMYTLAFFVADYFTGKGITESVIYHLRYGLGGAGFLDYWQLIALSAAGVAAYALAPFLMAGRAKEAGDPGPARQLLFLPGLALAALVINPTTNSLFSYFTGSYAASLRDDGSGFSGYYRVPNIHRVSEKRNLVYIYAEGLERTYFDETVFPGLISELRELESTGTSFTGISQVYGTGWTVAGLTATQCGIPLVTTSHGNSMSGVDRFLPNATCLGDLLSEHDYRLVYMSGSSVEFAGTRKLFESHKFDEIHGWEGLRGSMPDRSYRNGWGMYDDSLFDITLDKLSGLAGQDRPFALFLSTMDTHSPRGNKSRSCEGIKYRDGGNSILNAVACSDYLIGKFIREIQASDYAGNTVIVVTSDHLAMRNTATSLLDSLDRRNLFLVLGPGGGRRLISKQGSLLDVGPTLLPYLGFDGDIGLGRNLLGDETPLASALPDVNGTLRTWQKPLRDFWGFPRMAAKDRLVINTSDKTVSVNDRVFKYPMLIEFEDNHDTTIRFWLNGPGSEYRLQVYVAQMRPGKPFFWVDRCKDVRTGVFRLPGGYCVVYGRAATRNLVYADASEVQEITVGDIYDTPPNPRIPERDPSVVDRETRDRARDVKRFIAHAGGGIGDDTYTNSRDALDLSYKKGFRLLELDIIKTSDDVFVAAHDWAQWKDVTGYRGELPPSRDEFLQYKIHGKYTPLDMGGINDWFDRHPDAVLVTDKVNSPLEFSEQFTDKERLMMELFSMRAVREGIRAGIRSAMPTWKLVANMPGDKVKKLLDAGVTDIAASRKVIKRNRRLLKQMKNSGIRVYVFHVNFDEGKDETYVVCNEMDDIFGLYADHYDFQERVDCSRYESGKYWYTAGAG